ncbi:MAG TPA: MDR family MFS transporter [Aeromicrobium sp.]|nr:MDR family MFS transporter [Aeromicrobium sp.]HKY59157.1 MDR family MFS transporter [Aeromicrobium sp.]
MTDAPAITQTPTTNEPSLKSNDTTDKPDYAVLTWLVGATFVAILNETIMMNAIPRLMSEFEVSARAAQWLSTSFMLTMAVVIPVTGWFLQRVTTRQAYLLAMATFCTGTAIAAVAPVFSMLLAGRIVQAAGTAIMMPLLMTTLMEVVPEWDRGRIMGRVVMAISVAPALGPAVSGVILEFTSWRWMFGLVLPLAVGIAVAGLRKIINVGEPTAGSVNVPSVILAALGFGSLVYGLSLIGDVHAPAPAGWFIAGGVLVIALFVFAQLWLQRSDRPLLDLRTLTHRTFTVGVVLMVVAFAGFMGSMILLPIYLQDLRGLSSLETGLLLMPGGLAMGLSGPRIGHLFDRFGSRPLVLPGSLAVVAALATLTQIGHSTSIWIILAAHVVFMAGLAAIFTPVFTLSLSAVPEHLYSHASSLLGSTQQVAGAIGTAMSVTILSSHTASLMRAGTAPEPAAIGGMQWAFAASAIVSVGIVVLALMLPARAPEGATHH